MTMYFIRHAQSGENDGSSRSNDSPLTPLGQEQAERTGAWLASDTGRNPLPTLVYASPALRTLETARVIADACGAPIVADPELCEYGMLYEEDGLTAEEVRTIAPEVRLPDGFPARGGWASAWNGESKDAMIARVERVLSRYLEKHPPGSSPVAIVSHAHFSGFLLGRMFEIPVPVLSQNRLRLFNCGVSRVEIRPKYRQLQFSNHTEHLRGIETP